jgi:Serine hydrolase (FSH1)
MSVPGVRRRNHLERCDDFSPSEYPNCCRWRRWLHSGTARVLSVVGRTEAPSRWSQVRIPDGFGDSLTTNVGGSVIHGHAMTPSDPKVTEGKIFVSLANLLIRTIAASAIVCQSSRTRHDCPLALLVNMIVDRQNTIDHSLNLPRILCLHGGGTNAKIFRAQCRVLERALKPAFRLCFAQAPFPSEPGSDVVAVYKDFGMFRAWLPWTPNDPIRESSHAVKAIEASIKHAIEVDNAKGASGEFVGLLGFSQGAKVAASLMMEQQIRATQIDHHKGNRPRYRFAVLLAGRGPLVSLTCDSIRAGSGTVSAGINSTDCCHQATINHLLHLPSIHVHGTLDPNIELHRQLLQRYCDQKTARVMEWEGGHRVPIKSRDVAQLVQEILFTARDNGIWA